MYYLLIQTAFNYFFLTINSKTMDFDDLIENNSRNRGNYREHSNHDYAKYSNNSHHSYTNYSDHNKLLNIMQSIRSNKKLKIFVFLTGILILIVSIVVIIVLLPVIIKLIQYISENGLQGVYNEISGFLEKIWKGTGK
jgi:hypothetical protein